MTIRAGGERLARPATLAGAGEQARAERPRRPWLRRPWLHGPVLRLAGLVWLGAFLVLLANDPGRMFFETKLSVDLDPAGFFASLSHLMDPRNTFGALNNQAIGYAMPMAPFYLAGHLAHVPVWLIERLWLSLIIAVGFAGLVKLAEVLGIGSPASRLLAGLIFALWPTFTIVIGSTSSAALPGMLAPWAVLPLTAAVQGRGSVVWAAVRSGAVVLCMSGVNATVTLEALLLPGLFILTYARGRRLVSLAVCWVGAVAMATAWWALPLLLQGKYAFNFLPYVEQASTTTGTESAAAALRGAGNWTAYLNLGTPWLPAGWAMVSTPMAIIVGAIAAACGLYGLAMRSLPAGTWLRLCVGLAAAAALAGYGRSLGGPLHGPVDHLLDGALAPFRNVYKLEPVIAAALALGLAHAAASWLARTPGRKPTSLQRIFSLEAKAVVGVVLIGLMLPYLSGEVLNPGSFSAVPRYWNQVAGFLAARSPQNTALVVPGDAHGTYLWGDPIDDPLVALAKSPWAEAGLVPYGGAGSQILLDTAENAIDSGEQVSGLAGYLQRAGVRYIVVRNDLDPTQVGYTSAALVHQTLALSGFTRVASFGPPIGGKQIEPRATRAQQAAVPSFPAVEVYAPAGPSGPLSPVSALPVSRTVLVNGGPDSLLQLTGQHLLGPGQPAIIAGDPLSSRPAQWAVTDGQRRADTLFGLVNANVSYTYTATETNPPDAGQLGRAGGPPRQLLPVPAAGHLTEAVLAGAASVTASSYGSWIADTQQEDPASAFDGDPATAWAEGDEWSPVKQWIQIGFAGPLNLPASIRIRLLDDSTTREIASQLRVSTAAGSVTTSVAPTGAVQSLKVIPGRTSWLRITIASARRVHLGYPGAGISDVLIPGVRVTRLLQPAQDPAGRQAASTVFSFHQQVPSPFALADPTATAPMARTFTVASPVTLRPQASALAVPGSGLDALLGAIGPPGPGLLQVSVASTPGAEPAGFPASLIRGSGSMPWTAESASPVIHLSWHGQRRIGSLIVRPARGLPSTPRTVEISSPDGTRQASIGAGGLVRFPAPLTTDRIDVSFPNVRQATVVTATGQLATLPVRLSQLSVPALSGLRAVTPDQQAGFSLACGHGPALTVDGRVYQTSVSGTVGELSGYRPLPVRVCAPGGTLSFGAGRHTLTAAAPGTFAVTDLSLASMAAGAETASGGSRAVTVRSWQPDQRQLSIAPGAASYLVMHGNFNPGWGATLNGQGLTPVRLDGWQQGFVVPAGPGGTITLSFRPAATYHLVLVVTVIAAAILLALAAWSFIGRRRRGDGPRAGQAEREVWSPPPPGVASDPRHAWLGLLGVTVLIFVAGGPVALAVPVLAYLAWWLSRAPRRTSPGRWLPWVAFGGMVVSGLLSAARPFGGGLLGSFGGTAQACALIALAAALMPAVTASGPAREGRQPTITTGEDDR